MKELFKNRDVDFCSLTEYIDTFLNAKSEYYNLFQLPPIQRNSVWNVAQIERLWDSILRGYPIGSLLVSPRPKGEKARDLYGGVQMESNKKGYFLLDGQQRTRSLLLGFKPNENARLWIDLNPNLVFDNVELNDRKFLLRLITNYQPWGMSDRNPSDKLNEIQKFNAREELKIAQLHYDYEVNIDTGKNKKGNEGFSWPVKAELPVPLDALINLCGGTSGKFTEPGWGDVCNLLPSRYLESGKKLSETPNHYILILEGIKKIINGESDDNKTRTIVLLLQNENKSEHTENVQDDMEVLFRRVNAGGTELVGEEMGYSLLKSSWDGAYEMVSKIVQDRSIGYLLSSTGIVMAATRLARFIQEKTDVPNPDIRNFRKWIGEKDDGTTFLNTMQGLLLSDDYGKSNFHKVIEAFCNLVLYREQNNEDIGLPKKLLLSIKPTIYHPIFTWIYLNISNEDILEKNRLNVLRYLMYCFLTIEKHEKASKIAMEILSGNEHKVFPDKLIYDKLFEQEITVQIPTPKEFLKPFELQADGFFRHWNELFNIPNDPFNTFRKWFWYDSKELLLWFQRIYAKLWFKGYDPTSNDAFDTPYDWDHIVPYSHLITSGASPETYAEDKDLNNKFYANRYLYINSIGNFRLWPFWANRSDGNYCHTVKLRMIEFDYETDLIAKDLVLHSKEDFFKASSIPLQDEKFWYEAGGDPRKWPQQRRIAWQQAVENRVYYLYNQLYNTFGFDALHIPEVTS